MSADRADLRSGTVVDDLFELVLGRSGTGNVPRSGFGRHMVPPVPSRGVIANFRAAPLIDAPAAQPAAAIVRQYASNSVSRPGASRSADRGNQRRGCERRLQNRMAVGPY